MAVLGLLLAGACGDDSGSNDNKAPTAGASGTPCTRGTVFMCVGRGGCTGRQLCTDQGVLGSCTCLDSTPMGGPRDGGQRGDSGAPDAMVGDAAPPPEDAGTQDAATGEEDCDNDVDDDGDGDADCADSECTERTCMPVAPAGWFGPILLYEGDEPPPSCGGGFPDEAARGGTTVSAPAPTCSTCTCSPAAPGCASFLNFETSLSSTCSADPTATCTVSVNSSCQLLDSPCLNQATGYVQALLPGAPPTCSPSEQQPTVAEADWDRHMIVCEPGVEPAAAGCDDDQVCAPAKPFDGELCIYDYFDVPCPSGPYSDRRVYGTRIGDTRGCTECECDHDCDYVWHVYDAADATCSGTAVTLEENACAAVTPGSVTTSGGQIRVATSIPGSGACAASGGQPEGTARAENPITVCCLP